MHPDIAKLLEVQDIDAEIISLQSQIDQYPGVWDELKRELRKKTEAVDKAKASHATHEAQRARIQSELRETTERMKKYQAQQMLVKTSKELIAIGNQIESLKATIQSLQVEGAGLLEHDERVNSDLAAAEGVLAEAKERARAERERIRQQVAAKKAKIERLKHDREAAIKRVPEESLRLYEQSRVRHPGDAIVEVRNMSCGGCHFALLPNRLVEVHQGEKLVRCDHCGRLLSEDKTREEVTA